MLNGTQQRFLKTIMPQFPTVECVEILTDMVLSLSIFTACRPYMPQPRYHRAADHPCLSPFIISCTSDPCSEGVLHASSCMH